MSGSHHQNHHAHSNHDHDHSHDHSHDHTHGGGLVRLRSRRSFLGEFGRGTMALAVFSPLVAAACGSSGDSNADADSTANAAGETAASSTTDGTPESTEQADAGTGQTDELRWERANLGFVSAYVLARGNTATIVDTGVEASAAAIGQTLQAMGLNYTDVEHLILTHKHGDHAGSLAEVMESAINATVYAGQADLGGIDSSALDEEIVPLVGGEDVFGLEMVATPGHTAGHMCIYDANTSLLVAGDAIFTEGDQAVEGPARFFEDVAQSRQTIKDLAALSFNTLLVGHGDPIESDASAAVAALASTF